MSEFDTTKFVNIDDEEFTWFYNKSKEPNGWTFQPNEERTLVVHQAETFAKHLADRILGKRGVKDVNQDTELRRSILAQILPELPEKQPQVKKLTPEDEASALKKILDKQGEDLKAIRDAMDAKVKEDSDKDEEIKKLKETVAELLQAKTKKVEKA